MPETNQLSNAPHVLICFKFFVFYRNARIRERVCKDV